MIITSQRFVIQFHYQKDSWYLAVFKINANNKFQLRNRETVSTSTVVQYFTSTVCKYLDEEHWVKDDGEYETEILSLKAVAEHPVPLD